MPDDPRRCKVRLGDKIKKRILLVLPIAFLLLSSGCGKLFSRKTEQEDTSSFTVYYSDLENTGLVGRKYTPTSQTFDGILNELLDQFSHTPSTRVKYPRERTVSRMRGRKRAASSV